MRNEQLNQHIGLVDASFSRGSEKLQGSASAILIDKQQGLILTHASLFNPLSTCFQQKQLRHLEKNGILAASEFDGQLEFHIILPNMQDASQIESTLSDDDATVDQIEDILTAEKTGVPTLSNCNEDTVQYNTHRASLKAIFECRNLRNTFDSIMPYDSWKFYEDYLPEATTEDKNKNNSDHQSEHIQRLLLSCFVLLKIQDLQNLRNYLYSTDIGLPIRSSVDCHQGDAVEIIATPFGQISPETFLNSRSKGIISSTAGPSNVLMMTDARCVPGCEGGALVTCCNGTRMLTGMIVASLSWNNNVSLGLSLACSMSEILTSMGNLPLLISAPLRHNIQKRKVVDAGLMSQLIKLVPCVRVGSSWGSAVHVGGNQQVYLTCSHVVKGTRIHRVKIHWPSLRQQCPCSVLYKTPVPGHFDAAVIQGGSSSSQLVSPLKYKNVEEGETVYVVGHAIFKPDLGLQPVVTMGIVSKVIKYKNVPVMIQTTCAVHSGASGGGVFNTQGHLVGLVVCNSKDSETGALYPHINMVIPMVTIGPIIKKYLRTKDPHVLDLLHVKLPQVTRIWNLNGQTPSSETHSHL